MIEPRCQAEDKTLMLAGQRMSAKREKVESGYSREEAKSSYEKLQQKYVVKTNKQDSGRARICCNHCSKSKF